jgi:hypothetical protein
MAAVECAPSPGPLPLADQSFSSMQGLEAELTRAFPGKGCGAVKMGGQCNCHTRSVRFREAV